MKHAMRIIGVLSCIVVFGGCATPYTPSPDRPFESIPRFASQQSLSIMNVQPSTEEHKVGSSGLIANLHEWTDVAIQITDRELKLRGARIDEGAQRSLRLKLTEIRFTKGWVKIETQIDMEVETGDGYSMKYTGINNSSMMAIPRRQMDGAIMRVVVEMLRDPVIVSYLTQ